MTTHTLSEQVARTLRDQSPIVAQSRVTGAFHLPPTASAIRSTVELVVDHLAMQPEAHLTDTRRDLTWIVPLQKVGDEMWSASIRLPSETTIVTYEFRFPDEPALPPLREWRQIEGWNQPRFGEWEELPFKIAVYDPAKMPATWTYGMVTYQIFPDRFADGDPSTNRASKGVYGLESLFKQWGDLPEKPPMGRDFFGGDLRGVIERLDYLHDLGIDTIYMTPIFEAASNHRYEAINFLKIDPMLGTDADFDELVEKVHQRGMKLVLDGVFNHCSADSVYFQAAKESMYSPYYRWFKFIKYPDEPVGWEGYGFMPEFIECPEMEEFFCGPGGVTEHWLQRGIDGWRLDVAFDNTDEFWRRFRRRVDRVKPGAYLVSELWRDSTHYMLGDTFNVTMNYRFTWTARGYLGMDELKPSETDDRLAMYLRDTPPPVVYAQMNILESHDTNRIMTICGGDKRRVKQLFAFQLAFPGAPMLYYGGETGMEGEFAEDGRRCMPWDNLDQDLVGFVRGALHTRHGLAALQTGVFAPVLIDDDQGVYIFSRSLSRSNEMPPDHVAESVEGVADEEVVYAAFNASDTPAVVTLADTGDWHDVLKMDAVTVEVAGFALRLLLPPRSAAWLTKHR